MKIEDYDSIQVIQDFILMNFPHIDPADIEIEPDAFSTTLVHNNTQLKIQPLEANMNSLIDKYQLSLPRHFSVEAYKGSLLIYINKVSQYPNLHLFPHTIVESIYCNSIYNFILQKETHVPSTQ